MNDDNSLESLSDQELSGVFAVEVCGWKAGEGIWLTMGSSSIFPNVWEGHWIDDGVRQPFFRSELVFATSADAVLPYLEKHSYVSECFPDETELGKYNVQIKDDRGRTIAEGDADTLARSACIVLIRAHRAAKAP